jgi:hypothetical protein
MEVAAVSVVKDLARIASRAVNIDDLCINVGQIDSELMLTPWRRGPVGI